MKYLKKITYISCFILCFSLHICYVHAAEISADSYYKTICEYGYADPYGALNILSKAYNIYPEDLRFTEGLNERAKVILNWSKGSQLNGKFDGAIYGYNIIIKTDGIEQSIKNEANICMIIAKRGEQVIPGRLQLPENFKLANKYQEEYIKLKYEYQSLGYYSTFGNYLFIENVSSYSDINDIRFDASGIPMVNYSGNFYYNPITVEQYALSFYNKYLKEQNTKNKYEKDQFLNAANWLVDNIDNSGALRYKFTYKHYLNEEGFKSGWVSAMAQGQALSVFARAYHLTGQIKYLNAGNVALKFLTTRTSDGGVMDDLGSLDKSLKDYAFFQLYVTNPSSYTLNGHMYTLIGLYDWSNVSNSKKNNDMAKNYFQQGLKTLKYVLPYYDIGGFVTYDLGYLTKSDTKPTVNLSYYGSHITLLDALYRITEDKEIQYYRNLWNSYIQKY